MILTNLLNAKIGIRPEGKCLYSFYDYITGKHKLIHDRHLWWPSCAYGHSSQIDNCSWALNAILPLELLSDGNLWEFLSCVNSNNQSGKCVKHVLVKTKFGKYHKKHQDWRSLVLNLESSLIAYDFENWSISHILTGFRWQFFYIIWHASYVFY